MSHESRRRFLELAGGAAAALGVPVASEAAPKAVTDADVSKLYDAAKKEGQVVWWTAHYAQDAAEAVRDAFKAKYPGIDVTFIRQTAQVIYQRLTQDLKANIHEVDVFASTDEAHYVELKRQNALAQFVPADIDKIPAQFHNLDPDNYYQLGTIAFVLFNYNPTKVQPAHTWPQLADPRFKGQITLGHPAFSGYVGNWVVAMNDKYGWDYFTKLNANQPKINRSIYDTVTDIVGGERTIGAGPDSLSLEKKAAGNHIDVYYPQDETILITAPVGIPKDVPHPNAARLFTNFYYSREYSQALVKTFNFPLRADVTSANGARLDRLHWTRVKVDRLLTGVPEVIAKWRETFGV
jgi:iron(III) transport system substrate-binding protein